MPTYPEYLISLAGWASIVPRVGRRSFWAPRRTLEEAVNTNVALPIWRYAPDHAQGWSGRSPQTPWDVAGLLGKGQRQETPGHGSQLMLHFSQTNAYTTWIWNVITNKFWCWMSYAEILWGQAHHPLSQCPLWLYHAHPSTTFCGHAGEWPL